ncbi:MAG: thiamine ABC transporter substrate binding subunit [Anaerolineales bacterium]
MRKVFLAFTAVIAIAACGGATPTPAGPRVLTVMTHDSFAVSESIVEQFEREHEVTVQILASGDAGTATNQAILNKDAPLADVFFGIDNTLLTRGLEAGIFEPYTAPALDGVPTAFKLDSQNRALPVDYSDVCLNYDRAYFEKHDLELPAALDDLTRPEYRGLLVVENPAASSPGLAFLLATVGRFGPDGFEAYWAALRENEVVVVENWETAYFTAFSGSSGRGPQPLVVSYASSPPAEVIFAEEPVTEAPTGSITASDTCFRQIEFVGILNGTPNRDLAEAWVDLMLSRTFQEDVPLQMFVFPVRPDAQLPPEFVAYAQLAETPAFVAPADIAAHREEWIEAWTQIMLR